MENLSKKSLTAIKRSTGTLSSMAEVKPFSVAELQALKLIHAGVGESKEIKAFRDLRTRLLGLSKGKSFSCLVVPLESGGGSHVAINLAAAFALDKTKSSLVVDCNLYNPSVERYMPAGANYGLTDYLDDESLLCRDVVYGSGLARVRLVPVGNNCEGGTEKLGSKRMKQIMGELNSRYDDRFIFVDAPPSSHYESEISILAELCDFILVVIPYGKVMGGQVMTQIDKLDPQKLAGIVFNEC
ncbi:XRE family transcriptional regulator [Marinagarivorans algicola]|uniref:XRE family transcriptional regulator n=1 Tax=Marinagarivorans algicola TaxID=1513270 RepID=UPI0012E13410|nr:XRE family transcriptional regulator [Marinagarivorans algicola]